MHRSKKSGRNFIPKKNGNHYNGMDDTMQVKKFSGKKKDKNWKNHLLDNDEDEGIDMSSPGDFKGFNESADKEGEADL